LQEVAVLPDPAGEILWIKRLKTVLSVNKIAVPMGVIGVIYESRPK
jgi:glutamate-5-semialdehyde dehydrogenase